MAKSEIIKDCKVLLIGGSAGSLEVLIKTLPKITRATFAIVIILHRKASEDMILEELFTMKAKIPVKEVEDKTPMIAGNIYIAPADYHLLFEKNDLFSLDISDKVNHSRPSIDVSFESAADSYGNLVAALLLSGANSDGTKGMVAIKSVGGINAIQKPETAEMPYMPKHAASVIQTDYMLSIEEIPEFITSLNTNID